MNNQETGNSPTAKHHNTAADRRIRRFRSNKRRSLFSSFQQDQPTPTKPNLLLPPQPSSTAAAGDHIFHHLIERFKKLRIPTSPLRRTVSEPIPKLPTSSAAAAAPTPPPFSPESFYDKNSPAKLTVPPPILRRTISEPVPQPVIPKYLVAVKPPFLPESFYDANSPAKLTVPPSILRRSVSDSTPALLGLSPERNDVKIAAVTLPSLPPLRPRKVSDRMSSGRIHKDSVRGESTSITEELRKMKEIFGAMNQWFGQVVEEEEEKEASDYCQNTENDKDDDVEPENETAVGEEAVSVRRTGECLTIKFRCPCSKDYSLLLSEDECYYKLV